MLNYASPTARLIVGVRMYMGVARRFPCLRLSWRRSYHFVGPAISSTPICRSISKWALLMASSGARRCSPRSTPLSAPGVCRNADRARRGGRGLSRRASARADARPGVADPVTAGWMAIEQPALEFALTICCLEAQPLSALHRLARRVVALIASAGSWRPWFNRAVELHGRRRTDREIGVVEKDDLGGARLAGAHRRCVAQ